jgi:hypothetical protein
LAGSVGSARMWGVGIRALPRLVRGHLGARPLSAAC